MSSELQPLVRVENLGKQYRLYDAPQDRLKHMLGWRFGHSYGHEFWALRGISFELRRGEMLGIIGRNGSGKSTLLQMIAGTLAPSEGSIQIQGRVAALLELGSGFNPDFTGLENIYLNASILGLSRREIEAQIDKIIDFADIGDFIHQPVKLYSSGMFVRLAFAITTGLSPEILLVDEALAVGDVFFRQKCHQRLQALRENGTAIIYVSHNLPEVEQYCDRAILLNQGKCQYQGSASHTVKQFYFFEQEEKRALLQQALNPKQAPSVQLVKEQPGGNVSIQSGSVQLEKIEILDESGQPCQIFSQGDTACFAYSFLINQDIQIPAAGIALKNEHGLIVHGKSSLLQKTDLPDSLPSGTRLRIRQSVSLNLSAGEYILDISLHEISREIYQKLPFLPPPMIADGIMRLCSVPGVAKFMVVYRKEGYPATLTHYGVCDLPGSMQMEVVQS